jgi:hypothetical protein
MPLWTLLLALYGVGVVAVAWSRYAQGPRGEAHEAAVLLPLAWPLLLALALPLVLYLRVRQGEPAERTVSVQVLAARAGETQGSLPQRYRNVTDFPPGATSHKGATKGTGQNRVIGNGQHEHRQHHTFQ